MPTTPLFANGLVKVDFQHNYSGRNWNVVRWLVGGGGAGPYSLTELDSIANQAAIAWNTLVGGRSDQDTFENCVVTDFTSDTGLVGDHVVGSVGTDSGQGLPIQVALCVNWDILRRYRGGHPKTFISAWTQERLDGPDSWSSSFLAAMNTAVAAFFTAFSSISITRGGTTIVLEPVNRSVFTAHAERPSLVLDPLEGFRIQPITASQRRRRGRA